MSLGNFTIGSTVRIPLQITEGGGIPVSDATNVRVVKIITPDLTPDPAFPKNMTVLDSNYGLYYLDYIPQTIGNYIVIFSLMIDSIEYTQMDSFYISAKIITSQSSPPRAKAVSSKNSSAKAV